jgi:hypothetical protein
MAPSSKKAELARREILALVADIERLHRELGELAIVDPDDREAYDILCRIERKLLAKRKSNETDVP